MRIPEPGERWKHYKGGEYTIVEIIWGCDDKLELRVIYRNSKGTWSRSLANFLEPLEDGPRFSGP